MRTQVQNFILFFFVNLLVVTSVFSQSKAEIHNVDFQLKNDSLFITYDLVKTAKDQRFLISIEVSIASGKIIKPISLSGDVGQGVRGGKGKTIIWDIKKDNVYINEGIIVEVIGGPMLPPKEKVTQETRFVHRGIAVLLSAVVPGLGITKLTKGGPYWIMAIGFYGAVAGSYLYYSSAKDNYQKYLDSRDEDQRNSLYSSSSSQNTISEVLMYTAGAVWLGSMIWTLATPNKTKPNGKGMSFGGYYNPYVQKPMFTLKYRF